MASTTPKRRGRKPMVVNVARIEQLAAQNLSIREICQCMGMHHDTWYKYVDQCRAAFDKGRSTLLAGLTANLVSKAASKTADWRLTLEVVKRVADNWRDEPVVQQTINASGAVTIQSELDEAAQVRVAAAFLRSKGCQVIENDQ